MKKKVCTYMKAISYKNRPRRKQKYIINEYQVGHILPLSHCIILWFIAFCSVPYLFSKKVQILRKASGIRFSTFGQCFCHLVFKTALAVSVPICIEKFHGPFVLYQYVSKNFMGHLSFMPLEVLKSPLGLFGFLD